MTEQELYDLLWTKMCDSKDANYTAVAAAKKPIKDWNQIPPVYQPEAYAEMAKDAALVSGAGAIEPLKTGTTVRIVMVSRLGDMGITRNLKVQFGYEARVMPGDGYLTNCRLTRG